MFLQVAAGNGPFVLLGQKFWLVFLCFVVIFVQFEANLCGEAGGLVGFPLFCGNFGCFGALEPKFTTCPVRAPKWFFLSSKQNRG